MGGFTKFGVTPDGGGEIGISARTESGISARDAIAGRNMPREFWR